MSAETPIGAIQAFLDARSIPFAGLCADLTADTGTGSYCAALHDDRDAIRIYLIGPYASEPEAWLEVAAGQFGWAVLEVAPATDLSAGPPF